METERRITELKPHPLNARVYGSESLTDQFVKSIANVGILTPLSILSDGTIISGHRRWRAAQELGLAEVPVRVQRLDGALDIERAIIESNRQREKTFSQKMREAEELERIEKAKREQERRAKISQYRETGKTVDERPPSKSRDAVAEAVGIGSGRQYSRAKKVWEAAKSGDNKAQELVEKLDNEETTITAAHREVDQRQRVHVTTFSSESNEYYTPPEYIEAARSVMGAIDLDPASHEKAQETVGAGSYFTEEDDGLSRIWRGRVWLNPPYGKVGSESSQGHWAQYLKAQHEAGNVEQAVLLVKAAVGYQWFEELWDIWPVCFARDRLSFIRSDGDDRGQSKQGTAFFYIGANVERFIAVFTRFGRIILPEAQR